MMITEVPGRARGAARPSDSGFVSRFLEPLLFSHRKIKGRGQPGLARGFAQARGGRAALNARTQMTSSNAPLASLAGGSLASRFHAWRGASGRRYICSIFPADLDAADAGLPDFADAIAMAVACDGGQRRCLALILSEWASGPAARHAFVAESLEKGAIEWHIHLLAADAGAREAAVRDIEACHCTDVSATG